MSERPDEKYIYLPGYVPTCAELPGGYKAMPGKVVVSPMDTEIIGGIYQVQEAFGAKTERQCGFVIDAGEGVPLERGDCVLYRPYDGLWVDKHVRMFGALVPWYDQVVAKLVQGKHGPEIQPLADWMLINFSPLTSLAIDCGWYESNGEVVSAGAWVDPHLLGKKVEIRKYLQYNGGVGRSIEADNMRNLDFKYGFAKQSWGLIPASEVVGVLN